MNLRINKRRIFFALSRRGVFNGMDDKRYLQCVFQIRMKKKPDLENPLTFSEKLQWLKLYDRKPEYTTMVDKHEVKKYVADRIGEQYIIPTLGVWDRFEDINFNALPDRFVLKCTHDSGGLAICRNKSVFDKKAAKVKINKSLKRNYYYSGREWPYKDVKPRIIAEMYVQDKGMDWSGFEKQGLTDYKFYCFNGEPLYLYISKGLDDHNTARISFLNMDWTFAPFKRSDYAPYETLPPKPVRFDEMVEVARKLSSGIPFLRVDLYQVGDRVFFSELTFSPCGGMMPFEPEEWDYKLGEWIELPAKRMGS